VRPTRRWTFATWGSPMRTLSRWQVF
jgi:hypothetical protein